MIKKLLLYSLLVIAFVKCKDSSRERIIGYFSNTNIVSEKLVFPNINDTSIFIKYTYFKSGNLNEESRYHNDSLKYRKILSPTGQIVEEAYIVSTFDENFLEINQGDTVMIKKPFYVGNIKKIHQNGTIMYESIILKNKKVKRIERDTMGVILKMDTISY